MPHCLALDDCSFDPTLWYFILFASLFFILVWSRVTLHSQHGNLFIVCLNKDKMWKIIYVVLYIFTKKIVIENQIFWENKLDFIFVQNCPAYPFIHPFSHSSVHPLIHPSVHSSVHPFVHPFIHFQDFLIAELRPTGVIGQRHGMPYTINESNPHI